MTNINLLPWRERLQEERKRQFYICLLGTAFLAGIIMFITHTIINYRIDDQIARNNFLKQQIRELDVKIGEIKSLEKVKNALLARMGIIQELQANRTLVVHMFDELVNVLPKGIHLTEIQRKGSTVTLFGKTESNSNVSDLMRNINKSHWLTNPELREIKADPKEANRISEFNLTLELTNPYSEKNINEQYANSNKEVKSP